MVLSADRYLQIKDTTKPAEAGAVAELTASMAVITSAISLGWIYFPVKLKDTKLYL